MWFRRSALALVLGAVALLLLLAPAGIRAVAAQTAPAPIPCPADINGDGVVDVIDLSQVLTAFGTICNARECATSADCAQYVNVNSICNFGKCRYACHTGFADCNNTLTDGCELYIAGDPNNCGACGRICATTVSGASASCINGVCSTSCRNCGIAKSSGLGDVARYIIDGANNQAPRCRLAIWGDSLQDWSNGIRGGASYSVGIRDTWRCAWLGAAVHPDPGSADIIGVHNAVGTAFTGGSETYVDPVLGPPGLVNYYPFAAPTRAPTFASVAVMTTASQPVIAAYSPLAVCLPNPQSLRQWNGIGDWTTQALTCDSIWYDCPTSFNGPPANYGADTISLISSRAGVVDHVVTGIDTYAPAGSEHWDAFPVAVSAGPGTFGVTAQSGAASATPNTSYFGGTHVYVSDNSLPGVELLPIGGNGSARAIDLVNINSASPADLASWCAAWKLHQGSVNMIMFGQNLTDDELSNISTVWKTHMATIISQIRAAIMSQPGAVPPYFLLVSTPQSGSPLPLQVYLDMQQALLELSQSSSDTAFINLNALAMSGPAANAAGYFADGVHPSRPNSISTSNLSGVDYFAGLIWGELCKNYSASAAVQTTQTGVYAPPASLSRR